MLRSLRYLCVLSFFFFFFQAEDGIRDVAVTGVQTCALPISPMLRPLVLLFAVAIAAVPAPPAAAQQPRRTPPARRRPPPVTAPRIPTPRSVLGFEPGEIGRASCRERG